MACWKQEARGKRQEKTIGDKTIIKTFRNLEVHQISYKLALKMHQITKNLPVHETYEAGTQLRRASLSITSNIAEAYRKKTSSKDFKKFSNIGSSNETMVLIDLAKDPGYLSAEQQTLNTEKYQILARKTYTLIKNWI